MKFFTPVFLLLLTLAGCITPPTTVPQAIAGNGPLECSAVREYVLELARDQEIFDVSDERTKDRAAALAEIFAEFAAHGYEIIQKPADAGPISRFNQTISYPKKIFFLAGNWPTRSLKNQLITAEHERMHMLLEETMSPQLFAAMYLKDAVFRTAVELAAYKVSLKVGRRHGYGVKWETKKRKRYIKLLAEDYLINLALTAECLTSLSEELWGPVVKGPPPTFDD